MAGWIEIVQTLLILVAVTLAIVSFVKPEKRSEPKDEFEALDAARKKVDINPEAEQLVRQYIVELNKLRKNRRKTMPKKDAFSAGEIGNRRMGVRKNG